MLYPDQNVQVRLDALELAVRTHDENRRFPLDGARDTRTQHIVATAAQFEAFLRGERQSDAGIED